MIPARPWTDSSGKSLLEAEFVAASPKKVVVRKTDGSLVMLELAKLSEADRQFVHSSAALSGGKVTGKEITPAQKEQYKRYLLSKYTVKLQPLKGPAVTGVIDARLYSANTYYNAGGGSYTSRPVVVYNGKSFSSLPDTSSPRELPGMLKLIDKNFKITREADAKRFQTALDQLYPVFGFGPKPPRAIKHQGNRWYFIRGKIFDKFSGFVITTSKDGSISKVAFSMSIK